MATTAGVLNGPSSVSDQGLSSFLEANEASFQELGPARGGGKMTAALWIRAELKVSQPEERKVSNTGHRTGEGGSQTVRSPAKSIQIT